MFNVGRLGERPIAGTGVGVLLLAILPSMGLRWLMLKVLASWWVSETVGVAKSRAVPPSIVSPSSIVMSWIPTADCRLSVPVISVSGDSSDGMLSPLMSSASAVEFWWRIDGRRRERWEPRADAGRTVGDRIWGGGNGVVGDVG